MSGQELSRLEVVQRLEARRLGQREAGLMLHRTARQVRRWQQAYRKDGAAGLISKRRGKASNRQLREGVKAAAIKLLRSRYHDFGPTLAHEKLTEEDGLRLSVGAVRGLMVAEGLWRARRARQAPVHQMRLRRACRGELVQIDGSPHDWFEGRAAACTLLAFTDDATGEVLELQFVDAETTFNYFASVWRHLERHGRPVAYYSDRHGVFRVNSPQAVGGTGETQFGRALRELGIELICAHSPQAKGRVERLNATLQDRLPKELRLRGISTMADANAFLPAFMASLNHHFAVTPRSPHEAHRPIPAGTDLDRVFSLVEDRKLNKNLMLQHDKVSYQIQTTRPGYALRHATVQVRRNGEGQISIEYKGKPLQYTIFERQSRQGEVVSAKQLDGSVPLPGISVPGSSVPGSSVSGSSVPGSSVPGSSVPGTPLPSARLSGSSDRPAVVPPATTRSSPSLRPDHPWRKSVLSPRAALKSQQRAAQAALSAAA